MSRFAWLWAPSANNLSFAVRTCVSAALALYLAFWLQLDDAYWAFINAVILIQTLPGFLVVRSVARLAGTAVAGVMAIVLVALCAQSYVLFSMGLIAWVGTCVFCASLFRNNLAYGFVLAGYVTSIIAVRAMPDPTTVFTVAVARTAETVLAATVAAFVSVLLAPSTTARAYFNDRLAVLRALGDQFQRLYGVPERPTDEPGLAEQAHVERQSLAAKALALEQTRRYARFDAPGFAEHDRLARRLDYELLSLVSAMTSLQTYLLLLGGRVDRTPLGALEGGARLLRSNPEDTLPIKQAFGQAYYQIQAAARRAPAAGQHRTLADWVVISRGLDLANRARAAVIKHELLAAERTVRRPGRSRSEFRVAAEPRAALRNGVRAGGAMAVGAAIWMSHHDQPAFAGMMVLLSVLTTLFALGDTPIANARGFAVGAVCAAITAFVANFLLLPQAHGYVMLMIVIMPVVFVGALAMATPRFALSGRISLVVFGLLVHPDNQQLMTFTDYAETLLGVGLAIVLAIAAFALILPVSPRRLLRERLAGMFRELAAGFTGAREHFETRVYDRLLRLPLHADAGRTHVSARQAAFAAVNMGIEARALRVLARRAGFEADIQQAVSALLEALQQLFASGYPAPGQVFAIQRRANDLARRMLERALAVPEHRQRRHAIRAAVAAELMAAALANYGLARENADRPDIRLGEVGHGD